MIIWVDADACPRAAKSLIYDAAERFSVDACLVANTDLRVPNSDFISTVVVGGSHDEADDFIAEHVVPGDIVITADIPLAARAVDGGAVGIDPRGQLYTEENVKSKLAMRNLLAGLRESGMQGGGPPPYNQKDRHKFATALDRLLTRQLQDR
ncbi:YaiI/YqxD family protein [Sulfidibacter corallicola]|uniref:UPF0178 protein J3U87_30080 n=1 Tax=Sulfidibacter corallicola TaxID=2818388 RepID=A0A8A4TL55_SULCO|nr:YaiI/YqxD family protein [Sulfidibacter corallicola]QTD49852.1 YaiI/YqxD family protein [Sulfidibacter corallicola]